MIDSAVTGGAMHTITIRENEVGKFDVLLNGFSYRIHRNMNDDEALKRAIEIKNEFAALKQRSIIERCAHDPL